MNESYIDELTKYVMLEHKIPNVPLQKYYTLKRFLKALQSDTFTFQKPSSWDDPFEDFISKLTNYSKDTYVNRLNVSNFIYAMSASNKKSECDGMWRNFANTSGVLVHTSSKLIVKSLISFIIDKGLVNSQLLASARDISIKNTLAKAIRIKKVRYRPDKEIATFFKDITEQPKSDYEKISYDALSIKRMEYDYESEYRVFLIPKFIKLSEERFLCIGYFKNAINKIILSPKADSTRINRLKRVLVGKYKIDKSIIEKSKLYDIEHFKKLYKL